MSGMLTTVYGRATEHNDVFIFWKTHHG